MDPNTQQYLLAEFEALRREMDVEIVAVRDIITYVIFLSGVFWSWLFSKEKKEPPKGVEYIAPLLTILLCIRAFTLSLQIGRIGEYIRLLESKLTLPPGLGWETHFNSLGWFARYDIAVGIIWGVIIIINCVVAYTYRNKDK
jgi:hypothetical protein